MVLQYWNRPLATRKADGAVRYLCARTHRWLKADHGCSRNFSLEFHWFVNGEVVQTKEIGVSQKRNGNVRWDFQVWDPLTRKASTLHRVGCKVKFNSKLKGYNADHDNGKRGWPKLDWFKLCCKDAQFDHEDK